VAERRRGKTFQAIADGLMDDGIRTSRGMGKWYPATVSAITESDDVAALVG